MLIIVNSNQIQDNLAASTNNTQLGIITLLTHDIQNKNEDVLLIESTRGIEGNDKSVNFLKISNKIFVK